LTRDPETAAWIPAFAGMTNPDLFTGSPAFHSDWSSGFGSSVAATRYFSVAHAPRSTPLQRAEQNGR
jgi:hypothetical protein